MGILSSPLADPPVDFVVPTLAASDAGEPLRRGPVVRADDPPEGAPLLVSAHAQRAPIVRTGAAIDALGREAERAIAQARWILTGDRGRQKQRRDHRDAAFELTQVDTTAALFPCAFV